MLLSSMVDRLPDIVPAAGSDAELIERYRRDGDVAAITDVFLRHGETAWRVARRMTGNATEADDVLHDAYIAVLRSARRYRGEGTPRAWLLAAVVNTHRRRARSERRRQRREREAPPPRRDEPRDDRADLVRRALENLPERFRLPVMLRYVDGLAFPDIAAAIRCGERAARSRVRRGLERLRDRLGVGATTWSAIPALARIETPEPVPHQRIQAIAREAAAVKVGAALSTGAVVAALIATAVAAMVAVTAMGHHPSPLPAAVDEDAHAPVDPLAAALARPIRVRLLHDRLPEAMEQVAAALPPGMSLSWSCPGAFTGDTIYGSWPVPYFPWNGVLLDRDAAMPTRAVIDEVARQIGLRWSAIGGHVVFSRPLPAEERAAYAAAVADRSLFNEDRDAASRRTGLLARAVSDADLVQAVCADPARRAERDAFARHLAFESSASWSFARVFGFPVPAAKGDPLDAVLAPDASENALAARRDIAAVVERHRAEDLQRCIVAAGDAKHWARRGRAIATLAAWDDSAAIATVLAELSRGGGVVEARTPEEFVPWPGRVGPQVAASLVRAAREDASAKVRSFALATLARCRDRALVAELIAWFEAEPDQARRLEIAEALGCSREPLGERSLIRAIAAAVGEPRWRLVSCFTGVRSPETLAFLLGTATSDADGDARGAALRALYVIGGFLDAEPSTAVHQAWILALDDAHPHARGEALVALASAAEDVAALTPRFAEMLASDPDPFVRANAAFALYGSDDHPLMEKAGEMALANDADARVRLRALVLIDRRSDDGFAAMAKAAAGDADAKIRATACVLLTALLDPPAPVRVAEVRGLLRARASDDRDELVRAVAAQILDPEHLQPPLIVSDGCDSLDWDPEPPVQPKAEPGKG
jgi:RNA polymerase sigma-70 factor (ECF subfamily)